LRSWQLIQLNQAEDGRRGDSEDIGDFTDRHFATSLSFSLTIDRNAMMVAHRTDTDWRPDLSVCRAALILIQDRCDPCVGLDSRQFANGLHKIMVGGIAMLSGLKLGKLHLRVISALPVQHEAYRLALRSGGDILQCDAKQALLVFWRVVGIVP